MGAEYGDAVGSLGGPSFPSHCYLGGRVGRMVSIDRGGHAMCVLWIGKTVERFCQPG